MTASIETKPYLVAFRARDDRQEPAWLATARQEALDRFAALGFPNRRQEAWRFNDLRPLERTVFLPEAGDSAALPTAADVLPWRLEGAAHRLVLCNGRFAPALSEIGMLPPGAWLASTARTLAERPELLRQALDETDAVGGQPFTALNAALFADGFVLALEPGTVLEQPVEIIHLGHTAEPRSFHLRSLVLLGQGSRASLVETFAGSGPDWTNAVAVMDLAAEAALTHIRVQDEAETAVHFAATRVTLDRAAAYRGFTLTLGARLSRQDSFIRLAGEGAFCGLDGAFLLRGEREATIATAVDHSAPGGTTRELFKGVVDDRSHGIFLGRIAVRPDAQKSDAQQTNRNLLLSPRATIDTKPELEILADDVKCAHGATVGDLDETALFYLLSRGIPEATARHLLIEAFAAETLDRVEDRRLRAHLAQHLTRWLGERKP